MISTGTMVATAHAWRGDEDFWRVRTLLVETYPLTPLGFNWDVRRWDGHRFYNASPAPNPAWPATHRVWETRERRVVGAAHLAGEGELHLQLHPDFRHLEEEMVTWAEDALTARSPKAGPLDLVTYVYDDDRARQQLLARLGYVDDQEDWGMSRRMSLSGAIPPAPSLDAGYTLRTTSPEEQAECQRIADLLNVAFNRTLHTAAEYHNFTRLAPSFHPDLDLVAVAPDGTFAAYAGVPFDEANRRGIFEPVCTHPDHRQHGLATALMIEGMRRLHAIGAAQVTVDTGSMVAANRLYDSLGFTEARRLTAWRKRVSEGTQPPG